MGRVEDKVAFITGAARGQGRSHAVHLAEEGADIIAVDICADIASNDYPLASREDLDETARLVEKTGRRIVPIQADVRDRAALAEALSTGISELGKLDVVVANAGICPLGEGKSVDAFVDAVDVDLIGVMNAVHVALPHLHEGASIIMTGSVAGLLSSASSGSGPQGLGGAGYNLAKRTIVEYTTTLAVKLAPKSIRVNAVHPATATRTCCRASRCTRRSGPISPIPQSKRPRWASDRCRQCRSRGLSPPTSPTPCCISRPTSRVMSPACSSRWTAEPPSSGACET